MGCEHPAFATQCASVLNALTPLIDPTVQVRFATVPAGITGVCTIEQPTTAGSTHPLFNDPNVNLVVPAIFGTTFTYPTSTDAECLAVYPSTTSCSLAQDEGFIFTTDSALFADVPAFPCASPTDTRQTGQNFGAFFESCGAVGGDPHVTSFSISQLVVDLPFEDRKKYELYGNRGFRTVIGVSNSFITSIGITLGSQEILATLVDQEPIFLLNGEEIVGNFSTPFGTAELFDPYLVKLSGELAELERYLVVGLKIGNFIEVVGGIYPRGDTGFFNIEVARVRRRGEFGLLSALKNHSRRDQQFLSQFETEHLFSI